MKLRNLVESVSAFTLPMLAPSSGASDVVGLRLRLLSMLLLVVVVFGE